MYTPHFFDNDGNGYCTACGHLDSNPLHVVTEKQQAAAYRGGMPGDEVMIKPGTMHEFPTDLMPKTENVDGDFVYLDAGSITLVISQGHTRGALQKLHVFIGNLLAQRL